MARDRCVHDPSLKELEEAAAAAGAGPAQASDRARHPRRPYVRSGYLSLPKGEGKAAVMAAISGGLVAARARRQKGGRA